MTVSDQLGNLFAERGDSQYGGEAVSQLEHALQCAYLAEQAKASISQVVAALLHDVGHLLHDLHDDSPDEGIDDCHENSGNNFLKKHFGTEVTEPVRMHVAAKRYLCAVDESYLGQLSEPSIVSLKLQGGAMSDEERHEFESSPYWRQALELRRWDDRAKVVDLATPGLDHYLPLIDQIAASIDDVV